MDTFEARLRTRDLAEEALEIVERMVRGDRPRREDKQRLREMQAEARSYLPDAGYPAEAAWRGVQRASIGLETVGDEPDALYWQDVAQELKAGRDTLASLVSTGRRRESDFHIVG